MRRLRRSHELSWLNSPTHGWLVYASPEILAVDKAHLLRRTAYKKHRLRTLLPMQNSEKVQVRKPKVPV